MSALKGNQRVVIANIEPCVNHGEYPAKGIVDQLIPITADVFTDGHDEIRASVQIVRAGKRKWQEFPMEPVHNDRWRFLFKPEQTGQYHFRIHGWTDHFSTWKKGLIKKYQAGQDITVELKIGAGIIEKVLSVVPQPERGMLNQLITDLDLAADIPALLSSVSGGEPGRLLNKWRDQTRDMISGTFVIDVERERAGFSTWYELFPRSTSHEEGKHGTFRDTKSLLPRIAEMGFDVLYLPPVHPIGESKRKGRNNTLVAADGDPGSPWAIGNRLGGHKAINPELGTLRDFRQLIKEASGHGIEIAMDLAFQCSPDHPYVATNPQWFKWRPDGTVQYAENPPKRYEDILPFDFDTPDWKNLWRELKSIVEFWVDQGIHIFRVDNPHTKPFDFWEWLIRNIRKQHPEVIFLAEAFTRPRLMEKLAMAGFTQSYTYFAWRNSRHEIETYIKELTETDLRHYFRPNFWPNTPDILTPYLVHGGENAHLIRLILAATLSSSYGIYGPVYEFGINNPAPGKEEYADNEKYELKHWDWSRDTKIADVIRIINRIRKQNKALHTSWNIAFAATTNDQVICYVRSDPATKNMLIVVVNLDPHNTQGAHVTLPLDKLGIAYDQVYQIRDLLSGDRFKWYGATNYVQLDPSEMPAHIFKIETEV